MNHRTHKLFANIWILCGVVGLFINPNPVAPVIFCVGGVILHALAEIQEFLLKDEEDESSSR